MQCTLSVAYRKQPAKTEAIKWSELMFFAQVFEDREVELKMFLHLWKSYTIIARISSSITQMTDQQFCNDSINILTKHRCEGVIAMKRLPLDLIENIKTSIEMDIIIILGDLKEGTVFHSINFVGLLTCKDLLKQLGYKDLEVSITDPEAVLGLIRKTVLLLDMALVSYVRSHSPRLGDAELESTRQCVELSQGEDSFGFKCYWVTLTCLNAFLDGQRVWVFELFTRSPDKSYAEQDMATRPTSILTKMRDLADIWGPVYVVGTAFGLIEHYVVSKGVICRVDEKQKCAVSGAVQCHYYSRSSFFRKKAYKLLSRDPDLPLAEDDLLLIGGGLQENPECNYKLSDLWRDPALNFTVPGTKESVWRMDTRAVAIGFSRIFNVTVSGSQKLLPQTTLKQHILDKWTANPSRANPGIFNQYLGVEVSHCTGNARRISLRKLMLSAPIWELLNRQTPGWTSTPWGSVLVKALLEDDENFIFHVWKDFAPERAEIANQFCSLLELLDSTGFAEGGQFHAAMLYNNHEMALPIPTKVNDWSIALRDTHINAAYVMINEICLNCEVPDHSTSSCFIQKAYTVLQTQIATEHPDDALTKTGYYILRPEGERLVQVDVGSHNIFLLTPASPGSKVISLLTLRRPRVCSEVRDQSRGFKREMVYLRASSQSFHGKAKQKGAKGLGQVPSPEEEIRPLRTTVRRSSRKHQEVDEVDDKQKESTQCEEPLRSHSGRPLQAQPIGLSESSSRHRASGSSSHHTRPQVFAGSAPPNPNHITKPSELHRRHDRQQNDAESNYQAPQPPREHDRFSGPRIPGPVDDGLTRSDVYGQSIIPSNLGVHSILNDIANYDLGDDDADYEGESLGRIDDA